MKLTKQNNSTDRLLEIIRGNKNPGADAGAPDASASASEPLQSGAQQSPAGAFSGGAKKSPKPRKSFALKTSGKGSKTSKAFSVGVDIGDGVIRMVKLKGPEGKRRLEDVRRTSFDPKVMPVDSPAFRDFLRNELKSLCGKAGNCDVWSLIPSSKVDIWHLRIPSVAKKQVPEAVYWAVKKEKQFDENELMLDFEVQGQVEEKGAKRLQIMAYLVPKADVNFTRKLFSDAGYKLQGLTIPSLALQTLFRSSWVERGVDSYACLYVGRDWSRIDIFQEGNLVLNRGIKTGTSSMVESLMDNFNEQSRRSRPHGQPGASFLADDEPVISLSLEDDDDILEEDDLELEEIELESEATTGSTAEQTPRASTQLDDSEDEEMITLDLDEDYDSGIEDDEPMRNTALDRETDEDDAAGMPELTFGGDADDPTQMWSLGDEEDLEIISDDEQTAPGVGGSEEGASTMSMQDARTVFFGKLLGRNVPEDIPGSHLNGAQVFDLVLPAAGRLVRQVERTFDYHTTTQGNQRVEKIFLSGAVCTSPQIIQYLDGQLGTETNLLDPLSPDNPQLSGKSDLLPQSPTDRLDMNLALALAVCSDATTPNILYPYSAREKERQSAKVNQLVYLAFIAMALVLGGVYLWQESVISNKEKTLTSLDQQLAQYNPRVTQNLLTGMAASIIKKRQRLRVVGDRYESLAVLRELSTLTPGFIPLLNADLTMSEYSLKPSKKDQDPQDTDAADSMSIDGIILGDSKLYDPALTNYLIKLENSPVFGMPAIQESSTEDFHTQGRVLRFKLNMEIE